MRTVVALLLVLIISVGALAEELPARGVRDSRIRVADYNSDEVYRLYAFVGYQVDLEFEPGETYAGIGGGDLEGLTFGAHENHLLLKPKAVNVGTNLTVFTNRRHYHFEYSARHRRPNALSDSVIYAVRFVYPPTTPAVPGERAEDRIEAGLAEAATRRPRNIDY